MQTGAVQTGVASMRIGVLGPIAASDDTEIGLGGPTQRRLLAVLALHAPDTVSVDRLVEVTWPDGSPPERAEHNLRTYFHRLRSTLGDAAGRIETVSNGYRLVVDPDEIDAGRFERLVEQARCAEREGDGAGAVRAYDEALGLWRGRPYDELADIDDDARAEATRLAELRASALQHRFQALLDQGRHTEVVGPLRDAVAADPWRQELQSQLMVALHRAGRQPEALRAYEDYRRGLAEELGLEPSPEMNQLQSRILSHDPALSDPGSWDPASRGAGALDGVPGYELDAVIGEGAFAMVWRGTQPSLGRTVALKQIRADLANQPDFIRRFEVEAQLVAALEHPHIVPLYDYWREPGAAYLVMRHLRGGTLETVLLDRCLEVDELRRLAEQVGAALRVAHDHGVIHRDVKPGNILLDDEGNFFLTDFGIAFGAGEADDAAAAALSTGSPSYASPEQLRRDRLDARTDIYAFGITLFEAATGRTPFADERTRAGLVARQLAEAVPAPSTLRRDLPRWVDRIISRATAIDPADRYDDMGELLADVAAVSNGGARGSGSATLVSAALRNPFKGLNAFSEADAGDFRGRQRLVNRLLEAMGRTGSAGRLVAAVGPSGSGKSSVVRAGLIPALREGAIGGSADWFITTMMPGAHPFEELERALVRVAASEPGPLAETMAAGERGIARAVKRVVPEDGAELVLVIDQFEELYTLVEDDVVRRAFIDGLISAIKEPRSQLRVVLTVRADFWDRPLRHSGLAALLETAAVTVSPLSADELELAIVDPVAEQGMSYEPGLVARIAASVIDQPGALPLLQYTLTELFERRVDGVLTIAAFDDMGGVTGSLARRAEEVFESLSSEQRQAARRVFGRLVTLGEGTEDTRRRVGLAELGPAAATVACVTAFGDAQLLAFDRDPVSRGPTVEIAHEALIREWPRLRSWLEVDRDALRAHRQLTSAAAAWARSGHDPSELYRGARLEVAEQLGDNPAVTLNDQETSFVSESVTQREAEARAERRRVRRLRRSLVTTGVVAVVALLAGAIAWREQRRADDQAAVAATNAAFAEERADEAEAARVAGDLERLRAVAMATAPEDAGLAALLAVEAHRLDPSAESLDVLHRVLTANPGYRGSINSDQRVSEIELLDDGSTLVAVGSAAVEVIDLNTRSVVRSAPLADPEVPQLEVAEQSGVVVVRARPTEVVVFDLDSLSERTRIRVPEALSALSLSTDGAMLAAGRPGGRVDLWDVDSGEVLDTLDVGEGEAAHTEWNPVTGDLAVILADGEVQYWEMGRPAMIWASSPVEGASVLTTNPNDALFTSDGRLLVVDTGRLGGLLRVFDAADGSEPHPPTRRTQGEEVPIEALHWIDEEALVIGAPTSGGLPIYDLTTGAGLDAGVVKGRSTDLVYSDTLDRYVTVYGGINLWAPDGSTPLERRFALSPEQQEALESIGGSVHAALAPDGSRLLIGVVAFPATPAMVSYDLISDRSGPELIDEIAAFGYGQTKVVFSLDGFAVLDERDRPYGHRVPISFDMIDQAASADGRYFAVGRNGGLVDLYTSEGELLATVDMELANPNDGRLVLPSLSDDGRYLAATAGSGATVVWSTETLERVEHLADARAARLVGPWLVTNTGGSLRLVDPATGDEVGPALVGVPGGAGYYGLDEANDRLAVPGANVVAVYDLETGRKLGRELPIEGLRVGYTADGSLLAVPSQDGVTLWNYDTDTWSDIACAVAGRNLTSDEWAQLGPRTLERRATCPDFPLV